MYRYSRHEYTINDFNIIILFPDLRVVPGSLFNLQSRFFPRGTDVRYIFGVPPLGLDPVYGSSSPSLYVRPTLITKTYSRHLFRSYKT